MRRVYNMYVLCENAKEGEKLEKICETYGAYAVFSHNTVKSGKLLYEVIAFDESSFKAITDAVEA